MASSVKFDRHRKRSPAMAAYRNTNRMQINKAKAVARHKKSVEAHAKKVLRVPRGTARAKRRVNYANHQ